MEMFDPTTSGDSIARWDGDTLVVDTLGFDGAKGLTAIPGGGFRTSQSHLIERFRLIKDGARAVGHLHVGGPGGVSRRPTPTSSATSARRPTTSLSRRWPATRSTTSARRFLSGRPAPPAAGR